MASVRLLLQKAVRLLPWRVRKHYLRPLTITHGQIPYDAKQYWEAWYAAVVESEFSDGITISPDYNPLIARYHYNTVENAIIEYFAARRPPENPKVLDVGSGAGHWIDFYLDVFRAGSVTGVDVSARCVEALSLKYERQAAVRILEADISAPDFALAQRFDIINAIGVLFHIVDDRLWRQAVKNLASHLARDGVILVGGQFGPITQNVQFHYGDPSAPAGQSTTSLETSVAWVNKRIRSVRSWRECSRRAGLRIDGVLRTRQRRGIETPENNLLVLSWPRGSGLD